MQNEKKLRFKDLLEGSGLTFVVMYIVELAEEGLENLIALGISTLFSTVLLVCFTQLAKLGIKKLIKLIMPLAKKIIYREGHDKMSKVKKFFTWIWCNKKTLLGTASTAVITLSGTGVIDANSITPLYVGGVNVTPFVYYGCLAVIALFGIFGKGVEDVKTFFARVGLIKDAKEKEALTKEAKKEIKAEDKLAKQTQAQREKQLAKEEAEKKAKDEKEKAQAEHKAKVAEIKAQLLAETKKAE